MWIRRLEVTHCKGIRAAGVELEPGCNVLHGPNELGKSTLAAAVRAALLLQSTSSAAEPLRDWHTDTQPEVALTFEQVPGRIYRVRKRFGARGGHAYLDFSRDGREFSQESRGREVEGALQALLRWGIEAPGGRSGRRGMPSSLITTALLGQQEEATAIFEASLAEDGDDSGRKHLTEALQALAEDPRFKQVLNGVQAKVHEAFTGTGRRRTGRASPWTQLREDRESAEKRKAQADLQASDARDAQSNIAALHEELAVARADAERTTARLKQRRDHDRATRDLRTADDELRRVTGIFDRLRENEAAKAKAADDLAQQEARHKASTGAFDDANARRDAAIANVRALEGGSAEQGRRLREQDQEAERLRLEAESNGLTERVAALADAIAHGQAIAQLDTKLAEKRRLLDEADAASARQRAERASLELKRSVARYLAAQAEAARRRAERDKAREQATIADALAARSEEKRSEAAALGAPDDAQIERLRTLETERTIAREKLSVGIVVEVALEQAHDAEVTADDATAQQHLAAGETVEIEAQREVAVTLPDFGRIRVRGGSRAMADAARAVEDRWQDASAGVFARTGCETVSQLADLRNRERSLLDEAAELDAQAGEAKARAEGVDALERSAIQAAASMRQRAAEVTARLDGDGPLKERVDALKADLGDATEPAINGEIAALEQAVREREELADRLRAESTGDERDLAVQKDRLAQLRSRVGDDAADWPRHLAEARTALAASKASLAAAETALQAIRQEATDEVEAARAALATLEAECNTTQAELADIAEDLAEVRSRLARLEGETGPLSVSAEAEDLGRAKVAYEEARQALDRLTPEPAEVLRADLDTLTQEAESAGCRVGELQSALDKAEGALAQVGGQYLEELATQAAEEVAALDARERELELDYGGWQMLHDVLKEAEAEDAAHLGRALVKPVSERMAALSSNRYGEVAIDAQLNPGGIELGGAERRFDALSAGTREQIALLLRLSIAEALGSFVILDDQLTQSDAGRATWMHDLLAKAAADIQIIVLTCHPDDYASIVPCHTVDLTQCIARTEPVYDHASADPRSES